MEEEEEMDDVTLASWKKEFMDYLKIFIRQWYPDWRTQTYCVPPVVMNRVPYASETYAEQNVLVVQEPLKKKEKKRTLSPDAQTQAGPSKRQARTLPTKTDGDSALPVSEAEALSSPTAVKESDVQSDFAQQHVMYCLKKLGETVGPMFIISELQFADYLSSLSDKLQEFISRYLAQETLPQNAVHSSSKSYPSSKDMRKYGDFDILLVHPHVGILVGEVKSFGLRFSPEKMQSQFPLSQAVENKRVFDGELGPVIEEAVKQLGNMENMIKHMISDVAPTMPVKKTLILPYVTRAQLCRVLTNRKEDLRKGIGGPCVDGESAAQLCLCSDDLSSRNDPENVTEEVLMRLNEWFHRCFTGTPESHVQQEGEPYLSIIARLVGPASTVRVHCSIRSRVEVRTIGEAVSHVGQMCAKLILTPQQLDILKQWQSLDKVCLYGPPGTGKTVMLLLVGLQWMLQGHVVYIVCTDILGWRVTRWIYNLLQKLSNEYRTGGRSVGTSVHCFVNLYDKTLDLKSQVKEFRKCSIDNALHVLMDEVHFAAAKNNRGQLCCDLIEDLSKEIPGLRLWVATLWKEGIPPEFKERKELTIPLRSCPAVLSEVEKGLIDNDKILQYRCGGVPSLSDGPAVIRLTHHLHSHDGNSGHTGEWPVECFKCGVDVAKELLKLHVGEDTRASSFSPCHLQYSDVFVMIRSSKLRIPRVKQSLCPLPFVEGLKSKDIPCRVDSIHTYTNVNRIGELTDDKVVVGSLNSFRGLECKVGVVLQGKIKGKDDGKSLEELLKMDSLWAASRCSAQLIMVNACDKCVSLRW